MRSYLHKNSNNCSFSNYITLSAIWLIEQLKPTFPFEYMNYGEGKGDAGKTILKNYFFLYPLILKKLIDFIRFLMSLACLELYQRLFYLQIDMILE